VCRDDGLRDPTTIAHRVAVRAPPRPHNLVTHLRDLRCWSTATVARCPAALGGSGSTASSSLRCHAGAAAVLAWLVVETVKVTSLAAPTTWMTSSSESVESMLIRRSLCSKSLFAPVPSAGTSGQVSRESTRRAAAASSARTHQESVERSASQHHLAQRTSSSDPPIAVAVATSWAPATGVGCCPMPESAASRGMTGPLLGGAP
jgi:hypothetical protein